MDIELDDIEKWEKKRCRTYIACLIQCVLNGLETSMIATVLWSYLKTEVYGGNKKLFYCLICSAFNLPPILFNIIISRWVDKTRKAKLVILLCNLASAFGKLLFILPFSPYFILVGRFLSGFKGTLRPIMTAEMARSYASDELQKKLPLFAVFSLIGYASGPIVTFLFTRVDFWIGYLHMSWGNTCSFVLLILTIVQIFIVVFFVQNLSQEYDLKDNETKQIKREELMHNDEIEDIVLQCTHSEDDEDIIASSIREECDRNSNKNSDDSSLDVIKKIFSSVDVLSMLILTCIGEFWNSAFYHAVPYIVIDVMHYTGNELGVFFIGYGMVVFAMVLTVTRMPLNNKCIFYIGSTSFISLIVVGLCYYYVSPRSNMYINAVLLIIFCLFFSFFQLGEKIFLITCLAKMLYSDNQGIGESLRYTFKKVGTITGSLLTLYIFDYFKYCFVVLLPTIFLILCFLFVRRRFLSNPQPLV